VVVIDCSVCESTLEGEDMLCVAARGQDDIWEKGVGMLSNLYLNVDCFLHDLLSTVNLSQLLLIHKISLSSSFES